MTRYTPPKTKKPPHIWEGFFKVRLLVYPRSKELEYISEEEEDDHTNKDIDCPFFDIGLSLGVISTGERPCDTNSDDSEDSEEHHDIHKPADNSCEHILESSETSIYCTFVLTFFYRITWITRCLTRTTCTWYFLSNYYCCWCSKNTFHQKEWNQYKDDGKEDCTHIRLKCKTNKIRKKAKRSNEDERCDKRIEQYVFSLLDAFLISCGSDIVVCTVDKEKYSSRRSKEECKTE